MGRYIDMKRILFFTFICFCFYTRGQETKTIHVFVALCDNVNQGIVPVSRTLGNGQNPKTNLYWGALYGVKTHFKRSEDWEFVDTPKTTDPKILDRALFKHKHSDTYLLADAYDGRYIKEATIDFLQAAGGREADKVNYNGTDLSVGGDAELVAYIGHDGLMEFSLDQDFNSDSSKEKDAIILACISKDYFSPYLKQTGATPLVWTTGLMAPEAYTLKWAIDGWIKGESNDEIRERAAQAYNHYQKCGMRGARNLLVTGY